MGPTNDNQACLGAAGAFAGARERQAAQPRPGLDLRSPAVQAVAAFLRRALPRGERSLGKRSLIEIGCGSSAWLPFFAQELGYRIFGLEGSPSGARNARRTLDERGVDGQIIEGDLLDRSLFRSVRFDAVFSFGFLEASPATRQALKRMTGLLKPGGVMVTVLRNRQGLPGFLDGRINGIPYERPAVMSALDLERRHKDAGLTTILGPSYVGGFDLRCLNWEGLLHGKSPIVQRLVGGTVRLVNVSTNLGLRACGWANAWWAAPMIVIAGQKGRA